MKGGNRESHVQGVDPNTKAQHMMAGWYTFLGGCHEAKVIKKQVTLEGLLRTDRRLCTIEVIDVNIDRNSLVGQDVHNAFNGLLTHQSCRK